jgi:hypothetical protein
VAPAEGHSNAGSMMMRGAWLIVAVMAATVPQNGDVDAVALGRSRDSALYAAFHAGYALTASGEVERAEVITEFRRAVLLVRQAADQGEYAYNANNLAKAMGPYRGVVAFMVQIRMHPLHAYPSPPPYDMYVRTGPATKPIPMTGLTREPLYPPGFSDPGTAFTAFQMEGSVARDEIQKAEDPVLTVTNDRGDVIWQARLDLSRFR